MLEKIYKKLLEIILKVPQETIQKFSSESPELAIISILITIPFSGTPAGVALGQRTWFSTFLFLKILNHSLLKLHKKLKKSDTDKIINDIKNAKLTEKDYIKLQETLKEYKNEKIKE